MKKEYKLFNDLNYGYQIQEALYFNNYSIGLSRFFNQMLSIDEYDKIKNDRKKQFEVTMEYLSTLLRNGELKMKTYEYKEQIEKRELNSKSYILTSSKEWKQEEIEEGIQYVREKWNSIDREKERRIFEDQGVLFTLPENEWMM